MRRRAKYDSLPPFSGHFPMIAPEMAVGLAKLMSVSPMVASAMQPPNVVWMLLSRLRLSKSCGVPPKYSNPSTILTRGSYDGTLHTIQASLSAL